MPVSKCISKVTIRTIKIEKWIIWTFERYKIKFTNIFYRCAYVRIIASIWYYYNLIVSNLTYRQYVKTKSKKYCHFQKFYLPDKDIIEGSFFEIQSVTKFNWTGNKGTFNRYVTHFLTTPPPPWNET